MLVELERYKIQSESQKKELKHLEEIISLLKEQITYLKSNTKLWNHLEEAPYWVMSNEIGNNLSKKSKAAYDVAVFDELTLKNSDRNRFVFLIFLQKINL